MLGWYRFSIGWDLSCSLYFFSNSVFHMVNYWLWLVTLRISCCSFTPSFLFVISSSYVLLNKYWVLLLLWCTRSNPWHCVHIPSSTTFFSQLTSCKGCENFISLVQKQVCSKTVSIAFFSVTLFSKTGWYIFCSGMLVPLTAPS